MEMNEPKKPRTRAALTREQFFDLVEWLRKSTDKFTAYTQAAERASELLGTEVSTVSIKAAMVKAGVALAQPITPEQQLQADLSVLAHALLLTGTLQAEPQVRHALRAIRDRAQELV